MSNPCYCNHIRGIYTLNTDKCQGCTGGLQIKKELDAIPDIIPINFTEEPHSNPPHCHCPEQCCLYSMVYHRCRGCRDLLPAIDGLKYNNPLESPRQQEEEFFAREQDKCDVCFAQEVADMKLAEQPEPKLDDPSDPDRSPPFDVNEEYFEFKNRSFLPLGLVCFPGGDIAHSQTYKEKINQTLVDLGYRFIQPLNKEAFYINTRHSMFALGKLLPMGLVCFPQNSYDHYFLHLYQRIVNSSLEEEGYKFIPAPHKKA